MRFPLPHLVSLAVLLAAPRAAFAMSDGGDDDATAAATSTGCEDAEACSDAAPAYVVACDGGLCDTLQGRPNCAVSGASVGTRTTSWAWPSGALFASAVLAVRRVRRGTRRPGRCIETC